MWLTALKLSFRTNYYRYYYLLTYSVFWSFVGVGAVSGCGCLGGWLLAYVIWYWYIALTVQILQKRLC